MMVDACIVHNKDRERARVWGAQQQLVNNVPSTKLRKEERTYHIVLQEMDEFLCSKRALDDIGGCHAIQSNSRKMTTLDKDASSLGMHAISGMAIPPECSPLILQSLVNKPNLLRAVLGHLLHKLCLLILVPLLCYLPQLLQ